MKAFTRRVGLTRYRSDMGRLLQLARAVPPKHQDEPVYRVWTVKDLLGHIAAWDRALVRATDELAADKRPKFGRTSVFNKHAVDGSRALSYAEVRRDVRAAHTALMRRIEALSDEEWSRPTGFRWGDRAPMTVASLFAYTYQGETHYGGHARELEDWLARR